MSYGTIMRNEASSTLRLRRDRARARAVRLNDQGFSAFARRIELELIRRELDSGRLF